MSWESDNAGWLARAARWAPRKVEPLRLRVWLSSPLAWDGATAITIEGPLQFAVICRETGRLPDDVFNGAPMDRMLPVAIPIEDVTIGDHLIACASWGIAPTIAVESVRWRRKRARADSLGLDKVLIKGGPYKSLNIPVGTLVSPWLDFYVRGDRALLTDLCRDVQGLGRDSTRGMGTVIGVEITNDPDDRSLLYRGAPQRAIPMMLDGGDYDPRCLDPDTWDERETTTRAPYWKQASLAVCAVPVVTMGATIRDAEPIEEEELVGQGEEGKLPQVIAVLQRGR